MLEEAEELAKLSGVYNETSTVTANYTILEFEPAPPPKKDAINLSLLKLPLILSILIMG